MTKLLLIVLLVFMSGCGKDVQLCISCDGKLECSALLVPEKPVCPVYTRPTPIGD